MPTVRLLNCKLLVDEGNGWRMSLDGPVDDMGKSKTTLTSEIADVGEVKLFGWGL